MYSLLSHLSFRHMLVDSALQNSFTVFWQYRNESKFQFPLPPGSYFKNKYHLATSHCCDTTVRVSGLLHSTAALRDKQFQIRVNLKPLSLNTIRSWKYFSKDD